MHAMPQHASHVMCSSMAGQAWHGMAQFCRPTLAQALPRLCKAAASCIPPPSGYVSSCLPPPRARPAHLALLVQDASKQHSSLLVGHQAKRGAWVGCHACGGWQRKMAWCARVGDAASCGHTTASQMVQTKQNLTAMRTLLFHALKGQRLEVQHPHAAGQPGGGRCLFSGKAGMPQLGHGSCACMPHRLWQRAGSTTWMHEDWRGQPAIAPSPAALGALTPRGSRPCPPPPHPPSCRAWA